MSKHKKIPTYIKYNTEKTRTETKINKFKINSLYLCFLEGCLKSDNNFKSFIGVYKNKFGRFVVTEIFFDYEKNKECISYKVFDEDVYYKMPRTNSVEILDIEFYLKEEIKSFLYNNNKVKNITKKEFFNLVDNFKEIIKIEGQK